MAYMQDVMSGAISIADLADKEQLYTARSLAAFANEIALTEYPLTYFSND